MRTCCGGSSLMWPEVLRCRYAYAVRYVSHEKDAAGVVTEVHVEYEPALKGKPPKGVVNWVARPAPGKEPLRAEARLYADAVRRSSSRGSLQLRSLQRRLQCRLAAASKDSCKIC